MALETQPYDTSEYLDDEEMQEAYLKATCKDGTAAEIAYALGMIAKSRNMSDLARKTGMSRQALYKALSGEGNPEFATIAKVADALGLQISFVTKPEKRDAAE